MIESFWWIIYILKDGIPHFLVIKRQAIRWKIEWTAPKWKSEVWETNLDTAKREIFEETWIDTNLLKNKWQLWSFIINFADSNFKKQVTYFLFEYSWDENNLNISNTEGYIWIYKWLPIDKILNLIDYAWLRELYRKGYEKIIKEQN